MKYFSFIFVYYIIFIINYHLHLGKFKMDLPGILYLQAYRILEWECRIAYRILEWEYRMFMSLLGLANPEVEQIANTEVEHIVNPIYFLVEFVEFTVEQIRESIDIIYHFVCNFSLYQAIEWMRMVTYQLSRLLEVSINLLRGFFLEIGVTEWAENHPETMRVLMWVRNGVTFVGVVALTGFTGGIGTAVLGVLHNPVILGALTGLTIFEIGVDGHGIINPVIGDIEQKYNDRNRNN